MCQCNISSPRRPSLCLNSREHVPLVERDGFVVGEESELDVGAGQVLQQLQTVRIVRDGPDQNPVAINL